MSQQKLDSRRQQNTAVCSLQSLSVPGREWGGRSLDSNSSTGSTKSESNLSVGFPNSFSAPALFGPDQFSYPSVQCIGLISWREKQKCSCLVVVRRLDAFPSLPGIVPHRKKEHGAPARAIGARTTTPNVTHPLPTYRLGGTREIKLRKKSVAAAALHRGLMNFTVEPSFFREAGGTPSRAQREWALCCGSGALTARLSIKETESKRTLTRKLEELPFIRFAGAAQHIAGSQRSHTTCLTLRSEGP
ncbi:unnamed protein product [Brassica napus]|uniref:(rape) hypothetical protein n=1 Tax=Brassica napus TaxID=3708 RepID=A0A816RSZ6_BRANA|nr:unnamed protein product [Brassica napus]